MKPIIPPVDQDLLASELTPEKFLRKPNFGNNELYIITAHDSPNVMKEIGRLREVTFRAAGGGTGHEVDIDHFDTCDVPYKQLIVWNPETKTIIGGYRFIDCSTVPRDYHGKVQLATTGMFEFSDKFYDDYLNKTIELGRSFISPEYQSRNTGRQSIFAMDNLWDGLGALIIEHPHCEYFFGKVTMYTTYNVKARDIILYFMNKIFPDPERLVYPKVPVLLETPAEELGKYFNSPDYKENYKELLALIKSHGELIPPLINTYMNLSLTMRTFGTSINDHFGMVEETGILITMNDIYDVKKDRHVQTYTPKA